MVAVWWWEAGDWLFRPLSTYEQMQLAGQLAVVLGIGYAVGWVCNRFVARKKEHDEQP